MNSVSICHISGKFSNYRCRFLEEKYLSQTEISTASSINDDTQRYIYLQAHAFKRKILLEISGLNPSSLDFNNDCFGKPFLKQQPAQQECHFNLSHTNGMVALIVSDYLYTGIDVEKMTSRNDFDLLQNEIFTPNELRAAATIRQPFLIKENFFRIWVLKECFLKSIGKGISISPSSVEIEFVENNTYRLHAANEILETPQTIKYSLVKDFAMAYTQPPEAKTSINEYSFEEDFLFTKG